jgi:magnesium transporter
MRESRAAAVSRTRSLLRRERRLLGAATEEALRFLGLGHRHRRRATPPGALPGAMAIPESAPRPQVEWICYDAEGSTHQEVARPEELREALRSDRIDWVNVVGFGDETLLRELGGVFGIHPLALADVVNVPQRPKLDVYGDHLLIVLRMAQVRDGEVDLEQVSLVVGPSWVVTFQERPGDVFDPVRARIDSGASLLRRSGSDFLAYALIDAVVDGFFPVIDLLADAMEELEHLAIGRPVPETLARIHSTRRLVLVLERLQRQQRDALMQLSRSDRGDFGAAVLPYLRDVLDHAIHVLDSLDTFREMTVGLMDIYLSSLSNRANDVMKTLTVIATLFIPLTFLTGVYGMNFADMPELHWRWGYPALWTLMLVAAGLLLVWFRRRGWLGGTSGLDDDGEPPERP